MKTATKVPEKYNAVRPTRARHGAVTTAFVLATLLVVSCGKGSDPATAPRARAQTNLHAMDCDEILLVVQRRLQDLAEFLPPPWEPEDSSVLLNSPAAAGSGAILLATSICGSSEAMTGSFEHAALAILVKPPAIQIAEPVPLNFYTLESYVDAPELISLLQDVEWSVQQAQLSIDPVADVLPSGRTNTVAVDGVQQWNGEAADALPVDEGRTTRFWQVTPKGTGYFHYEFETPLQIRFGPAACAAGAGTVTATVVAEGCQIPIMGGYSHLPERRIVFVFLPGVFP